MGPGAERLATMQPHPFDSDEASPLPADPAVMFVVPLLAGKPPNAVVPPWLAVELPPDGEAEPPAPELRGPPEPAVLPAVDVLAPPLAEAPIPVPPLPLITPPAALAPPLLPAIPPLPIMPVLFVAPPALVVPPMPGAPPALGIPPLPVLLMPQLPVGLSRPRKVMTLP